MGNLKAIAFMLAVLYPLTAMAFDETDQTRQRRYKSKKTCAVCHLLQTGVRSGLKMIGANLLGSDLRQLNLRHADLRRSNLRGLDLQGVDLSGARLRGALLRGANLQGASLRGADLWGADLTGAKLSGADLRDANLGRAILKDAGVKGVKANGVRFCKTVLPSGKVMKPGCRWWQIEAPHNIARPVNQTLRSFANKQPSRSVDQGEVAAAWQLMGLSQLFRISITRPQDDDGHTN